MCAAKQAPRDPFNLRERRLGLTEIVERGTDVQAERLGVNGPADVARLALRVVGARLRRDRDSLRIFCVGIILLGSTRLLYFLAEFSYLRICSSWGSRFGMGKAV